MYAGNNKIIFVNNQCVINSQYHNHSHFLIVILIREKMRIALLIMFFV